MLSTVFCATAGSGEERGLFQCSIFMMPWMGNLASSEAFLISSASCIVGTLPTFHGVETGFLGDFELFFQTSAAFDHRQQDGLFDGQFSGGG
jgi:hypothetical protein